MYTVEVDIKWAPFQDQIHQHHIPYIYIYIYLCCGGGWCNIKFCKGSISMSSFFNNLDLMKLVLKA